MFKAYRDIGLAVIAAKGDDLGGGWILMRGTVFVLFI